MALQPGSPSSPAFVNGRGQALGKDSMIRLTKQLVALAGIMFVDER